MLVQSDINYQNAQVEVSTETQGENLGKALISLNAFSRYDAHYQDAQKQIVALKKAESLSYLMRTLTDEYNTYSTDYATCMKDFHSAVNQINGVIYDGYGDDSLNIAQSAPASANTYEINFTQDINNICETLGTIKSNSLVNGFDTAVLIQNFNDISASGWDMYQ